ncbi:hypothetical protein AMS68_002746 [Peltaster fructicola]|uniref:PHD-type domain-containing protein n=1 Tax=Peltaster fructicola TaxID=286661 RepID=A0A6H0XRH6_9PEZI|nr:hypothetical protein AMS68_002746 [Peltaster fructicola]
MAASQGDSPAPVKRPVGRPRIHPHKHASEPPRKKRKYITNTDGLPNGDTNDDNIEGVAGLGAADLTATPRSAMQTRPRRERPERYIPPMTTPRPRYSNSASAAAASQASDGYKPREERSWEDFHPDLDIDAPLLIFTADEVDGRNKDNPVAAAIAQLAAQKEAEKAKTDGEGEGDMNGQDHAIAEATPVKRKPGRPPRRPESMLNGLGSPPAPRITPLPTHNPKERLNLPKPSFRQFSHFLKFEEDQKENKVNYVDRSMAAIGFQESDRFELPEQSLIRLSEAQQIEDEADVGLRLASDLQQTSPSAAVVSRVEYDMDEQDEEWLEALNTQRNADGVEGIKPAIFEIVMTQIEREYHALEKRIPKPQPRHAQTHRPRSSSQAAVNGDPNPPGDEPDSKCAICDDGDCENANAIIFCDGCDLAVHQECYGVPFIPEGQWFCRKCKEIGRGTPTCIFCPNVDGAFKQTTTLRWSHLLCAIWIPEVTIANPTFMEPITDVDKVPKGRWKLHCYICNQKMGACIQCSNKSCYLAFHATCARRAKLFLKMKSQHQAGIDTNALKAFCDKHVPPEWRRTQGTDRAILEAKHWYRHAMKDHKWADSQAAAQELGAPPPPDGGLADGTIATDDTITVANQKRKRNEKPKIYWRLPSGAPIVPAVVIETVEASLQRFTIHRRKEFVEKICRYWTLKREARRGAALLKRLQLQLESFSSIEITRRNFIGLAGREKLERRIDFAGILQKDMAFVVDLAQKVKEREALRLQEIEELKTLIDTVYFPIPAMLLPILQRAQKCDEKNNMFAAEFEHLAERLRERYYTSVAQFSKDFGLVLSNKLASTAKGTIARNEHDADVVSVHNQLNDVGPRAAQNSALSHEQKEAKKMAKRIVKAIKEPLEDAMRKEADLRRLDGDENIRRLDSLPLFASTDGVKEEEPQNGKHRPRSSTIKSKAGRNLDQDGDEEMLDADVPLKQEDGGPASVASTASGNAKAARRTTGKAKPAEPLSPPISLSSANIQQNGESSLQHDTFAQGGVPWYLESFQPNGTEVHQEQYNGRDVLRAMSEELSDMDEDTLTELATNNNSPVKENGTRAAKKKQPAKKAAVRKKPTRTMTRAR